jgi:hypothetical protein
MRSSSSKRDAWPQTPRALRIVDPRRRAVQSLRRDGVGAEVLVHLRDRLRVERVLAVERKETVDHALEERRRGRLERDA